MRAMRESGKYIDCLVALSCSSSPLGSELLARSLCVPRVFWSPSRCGLHGTDHFGLLKSSARVHVVIDHLGHGSLELASFISHYEYGCGNCCLRNIYGATTARNQQTENFLECLGYGVVSFLVCLQRTFCLQRKWPNISGITLQNVQDPVVTLVFLRLIWHVQLVRY